MQCYYQWTLPFKSASDIQLNRKFYNKSEITQDKKGNDVRPEQAEDMNYRTFALKDSRGVFSDPLQFYLQQGSNRVRLEFTQGNVAVEKVEFYNDSAVPKYQEYRGQTAGKVNAHLLNRFIDKQKKQKLLPTRFFIPLMTNRAVLPYPVIRQSYV